MNEDRFAIVAEVDGYSKPLLAVRLTLGRLVDDIVHPYQINKKFFIDGVAISPDKIRRLKILKQDEQFDFYLQKIHDDLEHGNIETRKLSGQQYEIRLQALMIEHGEDITSQVIQAYERTLSSKFKEYLPNRDEVISGIGTLLGQALKSLGTGLGT